MPPESILCAHKTAGAEPSPETAETSLSMVESKLRASRIAVYAARACHLSTSGVLEQEMTRQKKMAATQSTDLGDSGADSFAGLAGSSAGACAGLVPLV